jgi:hypothetical protein
MIKEMFGMVIGFLAVTLGLYFGVTKYVLKNI